MRFEVAVDSARLVTLFRSLEAAGFEIELLADEVEGPDPRGLLIRFGPPGGEVTAGDTAGPRQLHVGELLIDQDARLTLHRGIEVDLGRREFDILVALAVGADRIVGRGELVEQVWGSDAVSLNTVEVHVSSLRRKLDDGRRRLIDTVRGRGYILRSHKREAAPDSSLAVRMRLLELREANVARQEVILLSRRDDRARHRTPVDEGQPQEAGSRPGVDPPTGMVTP